MRSAILVLAVSLLVGWTSAAAAECAWVLWSNWIEMKVIAPKKTSSHGTVIWTLESAFENRQQCLAGKTEWYSMEELRYQNQKTVREFNSQEIAGRRRLHVWFDKNKLTLSAICLPDTIDPRERKE